MGRPDVITEEGYKKMLYETIRLGVAPGRVMTALGMASSSGKRVLMRALTRFPEYAEQCRKDPLLPHPFSGAPMTAAPLAPMDVKILHQVGNTLSMENVDIKYISPDVGHAVAMQPSIPRDMLADKVQCVLEMMLAEIAQRRFEGCTINDIIKAIPGMTTTMRLLREQSTANVATVSKQVHEIERRRKAAAQSEAKALVVVPDEPSVPNAPPQPEPQDQRSGTQRVEGDEDADATFQSNVGPSTPSHEGGQ